MKTTAALLSVLLLAGLGAWIYSVEKRLAGRDAATGFQPPLDPFVAARDTADGGFSRDYGFWMRPYCNFWSDAHTHTCPDRFTQEERNRGLVDLLGSMYELNIVNAAVFCKTGEDLAFVHSLGRHAPVWYPYFNEPDTGKLRRYKQDYNIRAVKLHNTPVLYGEFNGENIEFPAGSDRIKPVSIGMMVSDEWMEFYAVCEELGLPLIWHTNNRYGPSPYNFGGDNSRCWDGLPYDNFHVLSLIERILETYPGLDIILAHCGFMGYSRLDTLFARHPNLYVDTSAAFVLHDQDYLTDSERARIRPFFIRWADRILFGSDANAWWEAPDTLDRHEIGRYVYSHVHPFKRFVMQLYLPQEALSKVAHVNFERLYDMPPAEDWFF